MTYTKLTEKTCIHCHNGTPPLTEIEIGAYMEQLHTGWKLTEQQHLAKEYSFVNFKESLAFVNKVGAIAEKEGHHPDVHLQWGKVTIELWTHAINSLSESDFILAAKCDELKTH